MNDLISATPRVSPSANVHPGAFLGTHVVVEDNVIIGPSAVVLGQPDSATHPTIVSRGAQIGANATILPGLTIGLRAQVMPGAVVTRSVPPLAIVEGNPARIVGYVATAAGGTTASTTSPGILPAVQSSAVKGVTLHRLRLVSDLRGNLSAGEFTRDIPFLPKRYFLVFGVPTLETRGEHAHHECQQLLVAVRGSVRVVADDGHSREEFLLNRPELGLYLPPMTWGIQYGYTPDAVLLVFASDFYDPADYIRDYTEFLALSGAKPRTA